MEKILLCVPDDDVVDLIELAKKAGVQPFVVERWNIELSLCALEQCDAVLLREPNVELGFVAGYAVARGKSIIAFGVDDSKQLVTEAAYKVHSRDELSRALAALGTSGEGSCECPTFSECTHK